ncbi:hypothetical protein DMN91_012636, partial [Ooceraea biroi]
YLRKTWICFQCGKRYLWRGSLKNHIRVECGKEPAFKCPICGRRNSLIINQASSLKPWSCYRCGKRYIWRDSLKKHQRVECGKEPTFECPVCGRKFKHKHRWQSHSRLIHHINI